MKYQLICRLNINSAKIKYNQHIENQGISHIEFSSGIVTPQATLNSQPKKSLPSREGY
jgi:hypothetical protein